MIKSVDFWPQYKAQDFNFTKEFCLISITDNDEKPIVFKNIEEPQVLRLKFLDIMEEIEHPSYKPEFLFNQTHAQSIIDFILKTHQSTQCINMIVHCHAGVSRSAAVALFVHAFTQCEFPTFENADYANSLVVEVLSEQSKTEIIIPPHPPRESSIFIF